jgi:hypothetical protein
MLPMEIPASLAISRMEVPKYPCRMKIRNAASSIAAWFFRTTWSFSFGIK